MNQALLGVMAAACAVSLASGVQARDFYIHSTTSNTARTGDQQTPFKWISEINEKQASGVINANDSVIFACGDTLSVAVQPLRLKSGVTYKTTPGCASKPVLTGAVKLSGLSWSLYTGTDVPTGARIFSAKIPPVVTVAGQSVAITNVAQLFDETSASPSRRLQRARHPNVGDGSYASVDDAGNPNSRYVRIGPDTPTPVDGVYSMHLHRSDWKTRKTIALTDSNFLDAEVYVREFDWLMTRLKVNGVNASADQVSLSLDATHEDYLNTTQSLKDLFKLVGNGGYWLENKRWMLDSKGEWYFDPVQRRLYVWREDGKVPTALTTYYASVADYGITAGMEGRRLNEASNHSIEGLANGFSIDGLEVQGTALDGISVFGQPNKDLTPQLNTFSINNVTVRRAGRSGIVVRSILGSPDKGGVKGAVISNSLVEDANQFGITVSHSNEPGTQSVNAFMVASRGVRIVGNSVNRTGLYGNGPMPTAISAVGSGNVIENNSVNIAGFRGIEFGKNAIIRQNVITKSCMVLDDCGAIYAIEEIKPKPDQSTVFESFNSDVTGNFIFDAPGSVDGRPSSVSMSYGVYLDYVVNGVSIAGNFIQGAREYGLVLSGSKDVTVEGNTIVVPKDGSGGLVVSKSGNVQAGGNLVKDNTIVAPEVGARLVSHLHSELTPADVTLVAHGLAQYENNRYATSSKDAFHVHAWDSSPSYVHSAEWAPIHRYIDFGRWQHQEAALEPSHASDFMRDGAGLDSAASVFHFADPSMTLMDAASADFESSVNGWAQESVEHPVVVTRMSSGCAPASSGCLQLVPDVGAPSSVWKDRGRPYGVVKSPWGSLGDVQPGQVYRVDFSARSLTNDALDVGDFVSVNMTGTIADHAGGFRRTYVDKDWGRYSATLHVKAAQANSYVTVEAGSSVGILLDDVRVYRVTPAPTNKVHVITNTTSAQHVAASCPTLLPGQSVENFKNLQDLSESLVCSGGNATVIPAGQSKVFVYQNP